MMCSSSKLMMMLSVHSHALHVATLRITFIAWKSGQLNTSPGSGRPWWARLLWIKSMEMITLRSGRGGAVFLDRDLCRSFWMMTRHNTCRRGRGTACYPSRTCRWWAPTSGLSEGFVSTSNLVGQFQPHKEDSNPLLWLHCSVWSPGHRVNSSHNHIITRLSWSQLVHRLSL